MIFILLFIRIDSRSALMIYDIAKNIIGLPQKNVSKGAMKKVFFFGEDFATETIYKKVILLFYIFSLPQAV